MGQENFNSVLYGLKNLYTREYIDDTTMPDQPLYSILEQNTEIQAGGRRWVQPLKVEGPQGRSRTFQKAQANSTGQRGVAFELDYFDDFGVHKIERKTILRMQGAGDKAFFEAEADGIDGIMTSLVESLCVDLMRDGSGARGQVSAISGTTLTIANGEVRNFAEQMTLVGAAAKTTGGLRGAPDVMIVTAIDEDAGTITVDVVATGGAGGSLAVNDWLFVDGDRNNAFPGLSLWIPDTAPTGGSPQPIGGVNRNTNVVKLAGSRLNAKNLAMLEAGRKLVTKIDSAGGKPDLWVMPPVKFEQAILELGNRGQIPYVDVATQSPKIFLRGFTLNGPKGPIQCISDHNLPDNRSYMIRKEDAFLACLGRKIPDLWDLNGEFMMWDANAAGFEVRADYFAVLVFKTLRHSGVIKHDV